MPTWKRPRPERATAPGPGEDVDFMFVDATYRMKTNNHPEHSKLPYPELPVIELFGVTSSGYSVNAHVHGFLPYFYADSSALLTGRQPPQAVCDRVLNRMEALMKDQRATGYRASRGPTTAFVQDPKEQDLRRFTHSVQTKRATSIYGHHEDPSDFLRITILRPGDVPAARGLIADHKKFRSLRNGGAAKCYEANVEFVIRFMIDAGITGCGWVSAPADMFQTRSVVEERDSSCDIEFDIHWQDLVGRSLDDPEWQHMAPLVMVSIDAEVRNSVEGHFPDYREQGDMVISIANYVKVFGEKTAQQLNVFMVGTSDPLGKPKLRANDPDLPDPVVYSYDTEADMLRAWYDYINAIDADIIIGYNIYGFDMEYIEERMRYDKVEVGDDGNEEGEQQGIARAWKKRRKKRVRFHRLGKLLADQSNLRAHKFQNNAYGKKNYRLPSTPGRIQLDALEAIRRDVTCKFRSYRLDAVSDMILGLRKVDVHYKEITPLFEGNDADRARLGEYNLMDVVLPDMLIEDKAYVYRFIEEARVCNVPMLWLLIKGQQVKVMAQILRETVKEDLLIPMNRKFQIDPNKRKIGFKGAVVIDPIAGYYTDCVIVLDFNSLYPSIMRRWNLCFTTWIPPGPLRAKLMQGIDYDVAPNGHAFLKKDVKEGLLPRILGNLLTARARAKKDMAAAAKEHGKNSPEYKRQDGRQNALKVSANSVYGFTGAMVGRLPCLPISSAVTGYGREMIEQTKVAVEALDPAKYVVIYGDTDSVMVRLVGVTDVQEALDIGDVMEAECAKIFQQPVKIEKEKVFYPYALFTKKRYAGLHWERGAYPYYINSKGLISVRRDNALFASDLFGNCLDTIFGYSDAFDNVLKFVESRYPLSERGQVPVVDAATGSLLEVREDEEMALRDKGDIYAKIDPDSGAILRPGWVVHRDPLTGEEKKARVGAGVDAVYTYVLEEDGTTRIEETLSASIAERTRGLMYATIDPETGNVLRPGWIKKRDPVEGKEWLEMVGDSVGTAIEMVQDTRTRLYNGEIPMDMLTISKAFGREPSEYLVKQPHVELALRMSKRDAGSAPKIGDRVPFVVIKRGFKALLCEKAEDPTYVTEHGIPMDYEYYDSRQLKKPITQLFAPVLAKQEHREYMAPQDDEEDEDDVMENYVEGGGEKKSVFKHMMKASAQIRTDAVILAERKLFPQINKRKVEFRGASELPSLPSSSSPREKRQRLNAFDLLLGHAKREAQGS